VDGRAAAAASIIGPSARMRPNHPGPRPSIRPA
jgi:hypothetical protein